MVCCKTLVWTSCKIPKTVWWTSLKGNSHLTHHQMDQLYTITLSTLKMHTQMAHINRSRDMHHLLLTGSIKHHLRHAPLTLDWINQTSLGHINTVTFTSQYKTQMNAHASLHDWTYLKKILHHGCYWLLAVCPGILHMECSSDSTTVLDGPSWSSESQQWHWKGLHSLLLQWFCPAPVLHKRRNIILVTSWPP